VGAAKGKDFQLVKPTTLSINLVRRLKKRLKVTEFFLYYDSLHMNEELCYEEESKRWLLCRRRL
jgi:hypothetical protein